MNLPDFTQFEPLIRLKEQMGIPKDQHGAFTQTSHKPRAWILIPSGRRLDLLDPQPDAWTNEDLAIGISRTYRWGGYSKWDLPLSVAQGHLEEENSREIKNEYTSKKIELLHQNIIRYKTLFEQLAALSDGPIYLLLDELYHIRVSDQSEVIDYFHRVAKGVWLKIGTIRHRSRWYIYGDPP